MFRDICEKNVELFGEPGLKKWIHFQSHWKNLKNCGIKSYARLLEKKGVYPGIATQIKAAEAEKLPSPESQVIAISPVISPVKESVGMTVVP